MSRLKNYENLTYTPGIIHPANVVGQFGTGKKHKKHHKKKSQSGDLALTPIIAANAALRSVKPLSRLNNALEEHVKNKNNIFYKIAHGITGVGKSIGYGKKHHKRKK